MNNRDILSLKIPAYLRGELSQDEKTEIETLEATDKEFAADIEFQKSLGISLKDVGGVDPSSEFGWARLSKAIDAESDTPEAANDRAPSRFWQYAAAILVGIVLTQTLFLTRASDIGSQDRYVMAGENSAGFVMTVTLDETATTKALTTFLTTYQGIVTSGPNERGHYLIAFADEGSCETSQSQLTKETGLFETYSTCTKG